MPEFRRHKGTRRKSATGPEIEWVGGQVTVPFYVTEGQPYRPEMILWLELPDGLILKGTLIDPKKPPLSFSRVLLDTMDSPMVGPPRRPGRIRVADPGLAAEVRAAAPDIEVVEAPTPELDRVLRLMAETFPAEEGEGPSYLESGRVSPAVVEALHLAAEQLFRAAPWKMADDDQVLSLDIPRLGVEGACVCILGALGESLGLVIFPSLLAFERFAETADDATLPAGSIDLGAPTLALHFERGADLPGAMRREASRHGWPVAAADAYPWVQHRDRDGVLRPVTERDVRVVTACARALAAFFNKHGPLFTQETFEPVWESYVDEDDLEVRIAAPYEAGRLVAAPDPEPPKVPPTEKVKVGRNQPCPCGSGKKFKKCCLRREQDAAAETAGAPGRSDASHDTDQHLVEEMIHFAGRRFGEAIRRAERDFRDPHATMQLFVPWLVYHFLIEGKPVVRWFVEERGRSLSGPEDAWLTAQQASWMSVWEVTAVVPGRSVSVRDLLSHEQRTVQEISGSHALVYRDTVLARVVDYAGSSLFCGLYPRLLPPREAGAVVQRLRRRLRRKSAVPVERLRDEKLGRYMIAAWEEAVEAFEARRRLPPRLQNTDGDELLLTTDHFHLEPASRAEVESRLAALEGAEAAERGASESVFSFLRPGNPIHAGMENTCIGRVEVSDGKLRAETNSVERADALRARIEEACGKRIRHRLREHADPSAPGRLPRGGMPAREPSADLPPGEAGKLVRAFKEKHYAGWLDIPLPALGGLTPREAVRTKSGKVGVDLLVREMEGHEARVPEEERFSFDHIRKELGLDA